MPLKPSHIFEPLNTSFILDSNTMFLPFNLHRSILGTFGKVLVLINLYNYTSIKFYINSFFFFKSVRNILKTTQADVGQNLKNLRSRIWPCTATNVAVFLLMKSLADIYYSEP